MDAHDDSMQQSTAASVPGLGIRGVAAVSLLRVLGLIGLIVIGDPVPAGPS